MSWKLFSSDVTSAEAGVPIPSPAPYAPFADAWKEFDKLDAAVHGRGPFRWVRTAFDIAFFCGAGIGVKLWHQHRQLVITLLGSYAGSGLVYMQFVKGRFEHWQCPRCHAEWPGTKKEKDERCRVCGLKLHELA